MSKRNLIILSTALLLIPIAIVIYIFSQRSDGGLNTVERTNTLQGVPSTQTGTKAEPIGNPDTSQAKRVQQMYDSYTKAVQSMNADKAQNLDTVKSYMTDDLYQKLKTQYTQQSDSGNDVLFCAQDYPSSLATGSSEQNPRNVNVTALFGKAPTQIIVTVNESNLIDSLTCPAR
jgi:hypothetical protein